MTGISRLAVAVLLATGFGSAANAQSQARRAHISPDRYYALYEGRITTLDRAAATYGAVPPSESQTVMGLRVPR